MDAALITAWNAICQTLQPAFTAPTAVTFLHIVTGWVLCRSRPTVTNLVRTIGDGLLGHAARHWITYEHFFYRAAWSLDTLSTLLLQGLIAPLIRDHGDGEERVLDLNIDDATVGRFGKHVAWAGYFKNASASNAKGTVIHWAHNWVIGVVALRSRRWSPWVMALPVLFALYRKRGDCDAPPGAHRFFTRQQLAARMVYQARQALPDWRIRVAADGQYATKDMIDGLPPGADLVSRMRRDAALYAVPRAETRRRGRGRPRKKGRRWPTPARLSRRRAGWKTIRVRKGDRVVPRRVWSRVCLWYHVCGDRPIRLVIVRDPNGVQRDDFFFCTDPKVHAAEIVERYYARWPIEESIQQAKQFGGFDQVQGWCPRTVERQAPLALIVQTLVKAWYLTCGDQTAGVRPRGPDRFDWMPPKRHPSYLDMLATLRQALWRDRIKANSTLRRVVSKILKPLQFTLCAAA